MRHWTAPSAFMIKQHLLAVYIITFHFLQAIIKLEKFIFVKTTSKKKIPKKEVRDWGRIEPARWNCKKVVQ